MPYIGKAPQLQGAYDKADNISGQFNGSFDAFVIKVGGSNKTVGKATNLIVGFKPTGDTYAHILEPDVDYTVSGYEITFDSPPASGDYCWIVILGDVGAV